MLYHFYLIYLFLLSGIPTVAEYSDKGLTSFIGCLFNCVDICLDVPFNEFYLSISS